MLLEQVQGACRREGLQVAATVGSTLGGAAPELGHERLEFGLVSKSVQVGSLEA
jgi:hypothetical protein